MCNMAWYHRAVVGTRRRTYSIFGSFAHMCVFKVDVSVIAFSSVQFNSLLLGSAAAAAAVVFGVFLWLRKGSNSS